MRIDNIEENSQIEQKKHTNQPLFESSIVNNNKMKLVSKEFFVQLMCQQLDMNANKIHSHEGKRSVAAEFGCSIRTIQFTWILCDFPTRTKPKHLLWALTFLKTYETEPLMARKFHCTRPTVRKYIWPIVEEISGRLDQMVSDTFDDCIFFFCLFSITYIIFVIVFKGSLGKPFKR